MESWKKLCPCRSGLPADRCPYHGPSLLPPRLPAQIIEKLSRIEAHRAEFGEVRPVVNAVWQNKRWVGVGGTLYYEPPETTLPSFLVRQLRHLFGKAWWLDELKKAQSDQHPVIGWYQHLYDLQQQVQPDSNGLRGIPRDGTTHALLSLAYDLYVLRHHNHLQTEVVRRLRNQHGFPGARYELVVAATCVRAGIDMEFEDEGDPSSSHPEFVATFKPAGFSFDVEAKAKDRAGHYDRSRPLRLHNTLEDAARKRRDRPLAVFQEINMPPGLEDGPPWWAESAEAQLVEVERRLGTKPFDAVIFTNFPQQYGDVSQLQTRAEFVMLPTLPTFSIGLAEALYNSLAQYGNVPLEFEDRTLP